MKKAFVKIGELLLDVFIYVIATIGLLTVVALLCGVAALIGILIPLLAIYYAIAFNTSLKDSFAEQIEILIDAFNELFKSKDES